MQQALRPIVYTLQNFDRNFPNLVAPPTHVSANCLVRCKIAASVSVWDTAQHAAVPIILSRNRFRKQGPNRIIIDDAIVPQTGIRN